jgi:signal transduction histidine kinase
MAEFVTRFANVVKVPEPQLTLCDLSEEVETCHSFLEGLCQTHHIRLTLDLTDEATPVHLDTTLFQQVLVNIVKNAIESISNEGEIRIETQPKTLIITDNGKGISPEVAQHIFTPFYSTKPQGQGLGLLLIRDILTKHGCTFTLLTNPDDGLTRFTIMFP